MKKQSVVGILIVENKVLLLKRHSYDRTLPNVLCLPGGKVEGDERFREALHREFFEETGILIGIDAHYIPQVAVKENDKFAIYFYNVKHNLTFESYNFNIKLSNEHESYIWVDLDHLILYEDEIAPLTYEVLNTLKNE